MNPVYPVPHWIPESCQGNRDLEQALLRSDIFLIVVCNFIGAFDFETATEQAQNKFQNAKTGIAYIATPIRAGDSLISHNPSHGYSCNHQNHK